jgi:hypothetical protein
MWEEILKVFTIVVLPSGLKFFLGPIFGYYAKFHIITLLIGTVAGMMTSVVAFTFFGDWLRSKLSNRLSSRKKKRFTKANRRTVIIWKKFGLAGVAGLTPVLFTPIIGTIVAVSFGAPKKKILLYMLLSAIFWSFIINGVLYFFGPGILPDFMK